MANNITQYNATAGSNTAIDSISIDEGMAASNVNNAIRSLMSHLKNVDTGSQALTALTVTGALSAKGGAVFNEDSADVDFRVESNGNANMLFVNGGTDRVGIGTATPLSKLDVTGGFITVSKDANTAGRVGASEYITGSTANDLIVQATGSTITRFYQSGVNSLNIDATGAVTKPNHPCFSATADTTNIPLATTTTVALSGERFDVGSNLASNTFTAPITGKYLFCYIFYFAEVDADHTSLDVHIKTSNKQYQQTFSPDHFLNSDSNFGISGSMICDMDVNDTCIFTVRVAGGAAQTDIHADSQVSGALIC